MNTNNFIVDFEMTLLISELQKTFESISEMWRNRENDISYRSVTQDDIDEAKFVLKSLRLIIQRKAESFADRYLNLIMKLPEDRDYFIFQNNKRPIMINTMFFYHDYLKSLGAEDFIMNDLSNGISRLITGSSFNKYQLPTEDGFEDSIRADEDGLFWSASNHRKRYNIENYFFNHAFDIISKNKVYQDKISKVEWNPDDNLKFDQSIVFPISNAEFLSNPFRDIGGSVKATVDTEEIKKTDISLSNMFNFERGDDYLIKIYALSRFESIDANTKLWVYLSALECNPETEKSQVPEVRSLYQINQIKDLQAIKPSQESIAKEVEVIKKLCTNGRLKALNSDDLSNYFNKVSLDVLSIEVQSPEALADTLKDLAFLLVKSISDKKIDQKYFVENKELLDVIRNRIPLDDLYMHIMKQLFLNNGDTSFDISTFKKRDGLLALNLLEKIEHHFDKSSSMSDKAFPFVEHLISAGLFSIRLKEDSCAFYQILRNPGVSRLIRSVGLKNLSLFEKAESFYKSVANIRTDSQMEIEFYQFYASEVAEMLKFKHERNSASDLRDIEKFAKSHMIKELSDLPEKQRLLVEMALFNGQYLPKSYRSLLKAFREAGGDVTAPLVSAPDMTGLDRLRMVRDHDNANEAFIKWFEALEESNLTSGHQAMSQDNALDSDLDNVF